jgi:glycosyltransferase involved in cell wall biosynthesis
MLTPKLGIGGAEKMMLYTARGLIKDGYRVYIAGEKGSMEKYFEASGTRVYDYPLNQDSKTIAKSVKLMFNLKGLCKMRDIDIIYCHHRWPAFLALYASKTLKLPLVYHCHSRIEGKGVFSVWGDRTIAVSHNLEDYLIKSFGRKRETIKVIYNGVPELGAGEKVMGKVKDELEQNSNIDFKCPIVGTVGRLIGDKGLEYFIQSIPLILKKQAGVQFLIIGEGERKAGLMKLAKEMKVSQNTFFIGERADIVPHLELMNIFVLSSLNEGMPISILEALSLAKPVVATRVGGVPELIEDGVNGLLIESRSPSALASAVTLLLNDKALASRLGLKGREVVRNQFTVERMVKEIEKVFSELKRNTR